MNSKVLFMILKNWKISDLLFFKCVFYLFKLFGLATTSIQTKPSTSRFYLPLLTRSKLGQIYNVILAIGISLVYACLIRWTIKHYEHHIISRSHQAIDYTHTTMAMITAIFVLLVFCMQQEKFLNLGNRTVRLGELLVGFYEVQRPSKQKTLTKHVKEIYIMVGMTWLSIFATTETGGYFKNVVYFSMIYLCNQIITLTLLQYSAILRCLQQILWIVNENFLQFSKEPCQMDKIKIQFSKLRELYLSVCEIAEDIERFYAKPILLCIVYVFVTLIFFASFITKPMVSAVVISDFQICHCSFRILHYVVALIILVKSVTAAVSEVL
ncbi:hypothetical protein TSAR_000218 [Trichomalopsis sarcophagae]|uniref:Gustatory receptor n=1 Tax=Trichomalopsis sarcophagae TaxID=543379 RepID=A0A232F4W8_9HYME|nr:hypothetical protein TSAR_000218 [Trichomalopsis sarcophagae]